MKKPIIGIPAYVDPSSNLSEYKVNKTNINAITLAGGLPLILPVTTNKEDINLYFSMIDGLYLPGGGDFSPVITNQNPIKQISMLSYKRDVFEIALIHMAINKQMPIFAICRGFQILNLALGGTLYQDIDAEHPNAISHVQSQTPAYEPYHAVNIKPESVAYSIFKTEQIYLNSFHHCGVKDIAENLICTGFTDDLIPEILESKGDSFILAFQSHPECMITEYPDFIKPFELFIKKTAENM